jgi:antitoxin component of RelBE/YafQ-DinJ toxin-antitoxin module
MSKKKTERLNLSLDQTLKRQFDAVCALKGLSMSDIAQQVIREWVEKNAPPSLLAETEMTTQNEQPPTLVSVGVRGKQKGKEERAQ